MKIISTYLDSLWGLSRPDFYRFGFRRSLRKSLDLKGCKISSSFFCSALIEDWAEMNVRGGLL